MFVGLVPRGALDRSECALTGHAALELAFHFLGAAFLHRIGARRQEKGAGQRKNNRTALHLPILEKGFGIARHERRVRVALACFLEGKALPSHGKLTASPTGIFRMKNPKAI